MPPPFGSTPAHAGNTPARVAARAAQGVYPRPRGEYVHSSRISLTAVGLPPPTRGIRHPRKQIPVCNGSTPAHAGNTSGARPWSAHSAVYPRPRGEYLSNAMDDIYEKGLPPPTRGIPIQTALNYVSGRSTPAHAGNTAAFKATGGWSSVYPRPRGEYCVAATEAFRHGGLPPPTRGIRWCGCHWPWPWRSTPAHAGNTSAPNLTCLVNQVYPRPRGEYVARASLPLVNIGLPPPTRGIPNPSKESNFSFRSTPAHAGNTGSDQ